MFGEGSTNSFTNGQQVNLFTQVAAPNGLPAAVNNPPSCGTSCPSTYANIATELANINGALQYGVVTPNADPNLENISWLVPASQTHYYPAFRLDYNVSQKVKLNWAFEEERDDNLGAGAPYYPGPYFASETA